MEQVKKIKSKEEYVDFIEEDNQEIDMDLELTEEDIQHLLKSEEDIKMGRTRDAVEVFKEFKEKYGF